MIPPPQPPTEQFKPESHKIKINNLVSRFPDDRVFGTSTRKLIDNDTILEGYTPVLMIACFLLLIPIFIAVFKIKKHYHDENKARAIVHEQANQQRNQNEEEEDDSSSSSGDWERDWQADQNNRDLAR